MNALRLLVIALYVQALLGLARFGLPYLGLWLNEQVWLLHPLNGAAIAVTALVIFRPTRGVPDAPVRVAARFAALLPLALGVGLATAREVVGPLGGTLLHMAVGLAAIEIVGRAATQQRRALDAAAGTATSRKAVAA